MQVQLDFFEKKSEVEILMDEIKILRRDNEKLRKGLFARHGELAKKYLEINDRLSILEHNICRGKHELRTERMSKV